MQWSHHRNDVSYRSIPISRCRESAVQYHAWITIVSDHDWKVWKDFNHIEELPNSVGSNINPTVRPTASSVQKADDIP
jgi:hypothetical protein